ncbi:hypothetical protein [Levilactobacillus suantsaiihabitans]|uniref:Uncharacterized protein n=1 Tax=Levilactobacillus suantsaiihabitans TaxID=2487722 RepID=A0A4Z0J9I8_9LACO|nr:hypothetical protein [Levilactobacillus suantsaiihabitans]TGD19409.1 hypothetical protein EGT51_04375 [Levilactobacillus suantsaiihabitans]
MFRQKLLTVLAVATLGVGATTALQQPQPAAAKQNMYQKIPKAYRGTWHLKHSTGHLKKGLKLKIGARSFKSHFGSYQKKQLGVHIGKKKVSVFQIAKGQQVGKYNVLRKTHYKGKPALKWSFDTVTSYYVK